jgi:hypothetical protein
MVSNKMFFSKLNAYKCATGRCVQQSSSIDDIDRILLTVLPYPSFTVTLLHVAISIQAGWKEDTSVYVKPLTRSPVALFISLVSVNI